MKKVYDLRAYKDGTIIAVCKDKDHLKKMTALWMKQLPNEALTYVEYLIEDETEFNLNLIDEIQNSTRDPYSAESSVELNSWDWAYIPKESDKEYLMETESNVPINSWWGENLIGAEGVEYEPDPEDHTGYFAGCGCSQCEATIELSRLNSEY